MLNCWLHNITGQQKNHVTLSIIEKFSFSYKATKCWQNV